MPPKQTSSPMLTAAEQSLLTCAARIMTAIKYKEAHPERTFDYMEENLAMEMVRVMYRLLNLIIQTYFTQQCITNVYESDPSPKEKPHRMHPAASALAWEQRLALEEKRSPAYSSITFAQIKRRIKAVPTSHPTWPTVLSATDLATKAEADPRFTWWLVSDEEQAKQRAGEGEMQVEEDDAGGIAEEEGEGGAEEEDEEDEEEEDEEEEEEEEDEEGEEEEDEDNAVEEEVGATGAQPFLSFLFQTFTQIRPCSPTLESEDQRACTSTA